MSYADYVNEHIRISCLRMLREMPDGRANESVLRAGLMQLGFATSRGDLRANLTFLRDAGLVTHDWYGDTLLVAKLTERGLDVAEGREAVKGVHRPSPV